MTTQAPARTAAEITFRCRVNRIVDAWVSARLGREDPYGQSLPELWTEEDWADIDFDAGRRPGDSALSDHDIWGDRKDHKVDAAMRAAVVAEIEAIKTSLERRRRTA
jgi:hypothetical protein